MRAEEVGPEGLASALVAAGALTSDWLPTFQAVPREQFVPDRIWPGIADGTRQNTLVSRGEDPEGWRAAVYSDIPLTTQWDDGRHKGDELGTTPTSSSSMPRMVFSMLTDLDVRDGAHVLEIGTGTGWNAGLLTHRLGHGNVVSIEYDGEVARGAGENLRRTGLRPLVVVGDGSLGYVGGSPYDRVIATCSMGKVPRTWIEQTRDGGVIVAPWGTEYGGEAIVRLDIRDGVASGHFTRSSAFMRMRQQRTTRPPFEAYLKDEAWPAGGTRSATRLCPADTGSWTAQFAIGLRVPGVFWRSEPYEDGSYTLWLYSVDTASWATADHVPGAHEFEVVQSGPRRLWDEVERAFRWWDHAGRPDFERFGLTVTDSGQSAWLDDPARAWPV